MAKILIIGGVAVGATAAARLARINAKDKIIVFERDEHISFANCGLPYYLSGTISERENLLLQTPKSFNDRYGVEVRIFNNVVKINKKEKTVEVENLKTKETYIESYDYIILAPGANPIKPQLPGYDEADNIFTLRNIADVDKIYAAINNNIENALVVGAGFIGIEVAENLIDKGLNVTLVNKASNVLAPFDEEMAAFVENTLRNKGINLINNNSVVEFKDNGKVAILEDQTKIKTDVTIMAIGVKPETKLAVEAGLEIGISGGIVTNEMLQTSDKYIYAGGDAIEVTHVINNQKCLVPLAGPANRQGRIIADNIHKAKKTYKGSLGSSVLKIFDYTAASTGLNARQLKANKIAFEEIHIHRGSHAGYYPGASDIALKLLFDKKSGKIFGAQAFGQEGVEKRIDVIATAIYGNLTVFDLTELELTYAPPYSSAKDPVNIAGYVAQNVINRSHKTFKVQDVEKLVENNKIIIDVRTSEEYELGHIENSINIPVDDFHNFDLDLPGEELYLVCQVGLRGYLAQQLLKQRNPKIKTKNLSGGYRLYKEYINAKNEVSSFVNLKATTGINEVKVSTELLEIDARGMQCPGPIIKLKKEIEKINNGQQLLIKVSDQGFACDVKSWCLLNGHILVDLQFIDGYIQAIIEKGSCSASGVCKTEIFPSKNKQTIVVFSNDYDKLIASLIIANGALAMGKEASMFFTFWGLATLRKENGKAKKNFIENMFGMMLPKGIKKTKLSKMQYFGIGKKMMTSIMKSKNVMKPDELLEEFIANGGKVIACTMSMDVMGFKEEEFIDGVEYAGVATYLQDADEAFSNLFI